MKAINGILFDKDGTLMSFDCFRRGRHPYARRAARADCQYKQALRPVTLGAAVFPLTRQKARRKCFFEKKGSPFVSAPGVIHPFPSRAERNTHIF